MRATLVLGLCCVLLGCQTTTSDPSRPGPLPQNYREVAANHVKTAFIDPYSVRDAEIARPKMASGPSLHSDGSFYSAWVICLRANAKNRLGAYTGRSVTALSVSNGSVVNVWDEAHHSQMACSDVTYEPFPEVEQRNPSSSAKR